MLDILVGLISVDNWDEATSQSGKKEDVEAGRIGKVVMYIGEVNIV